MSLRLSSLIFNFLPIKKKRVCFINFDGQGFGDNPKYIALELLKHEGFELIWLYNPKKKIDFSEFPKGIRLVKKDSLLGLYCMSTCNVLISNVRVSFFSKGFRKKKNQIYIQTWHGSFCGIKTIGVLNKSMDAKYIKNAKVDSKYIDYVLSGSKWFAEKVLDKESFFYKGNVCQFGTPRNDVFFNDDKKIQQKVRKYFNLSQDAKILLYVPTFRDNHEQDKYLIDYERLKKILEEKFAGKWKIISRLHPNLWKSSNILPNFEYVMDGSTYPDIQELLVVADAAISDYSSCIFDYLLSNKPAFLYVTDLDYYREGRGFYYDIYTTPFPIAENTDQLENCIRQFNLLEFQRKVSNFLKSKDSYEKGIASRKCVELILKEIRSKRRKNEKEN